MTSRITQKGSTSLHSSMITPKLGTKRTRSTSIADKTALNKRICQCNGNRGRMTSEIHLDSESSFPYWLLNIERTLCVSHEGYLVPDLIPLKGDNDAYKKKVWDAHHKCLMDPRMNRILNEKLSLLICPQWWHLISLYNSACKNFEIIKNTFQTKITAQFLLELEASMMFHSPESIMFQQQLDLLSRIYYIVFREVACLKIVSHWRARAAQNRIRLLNHFSMDTAAPWSC
ncbi:hypothetical protein CAAN1_02S06788 [[Candida] anglica]|uniref:Uncharacterized protein n=1 Tax=[Candida] anglica TaxID=148631 RepID=A0ABP0EGQ1_9ASCO